MQPKQFEQIIKRGYSLDLVYILSIINTSELEELIKSSVKIETLYKTIIRKDLYSENTQELTQSGKELLEFYNSNEPTLKIVKKTQESDFERWWKAFPGTDTFVFKNRTFKGSRALKSGKKDCEIKFNKILNEGLYTVDQLIHALNYEIAQKKEASYKTGTNNLKYMKNSLTYLRNYTFESYIELISEKITINTNLGSTDI